MRSFRALLLAALAALLWLPSMAAALDVPRFTGYVTDRAHMISIEAQQAINERLAELDRTDSTQVAVLTVNSLKGDSLEDFSIRVAEAWKVGHKGSDNGVLLIVSKADRKIRIEVGYGLEGVLTDVLASQIIANIIGPHFRAGDYDTGFIEGVAAIAGAVRGEYSAPPAAPEHRSRGGLLPLIVIPMFIIIGLTELFGRRQRRTQVINGRVVQERGLGADAASQTASTLFFLSLFGGHRGGGGGFGGGGFGGGGFGGFGGGGFGGGGASGGW